VIVLVAVLFFATTVQCVVAWRGGNGSLLRGKHPDADVTRSGTVHQLGRTMLAGPVVFGAMGLVLVTHQLLGTWHLAAIRALLYALYGASWALVLIGVFGSYYLSRTGKPRFLIPPQYRDR
jgi:hypothetical protein